MRFRWSDVPDSECLKMLDQFYPAHAGHPKMRLPLTDDSDPNNLEFACYCNGNATEEVQVMHISRYELDEKKNLFTKEMDELKGAGSL